MFSRLLFCSSSGSGTPSAGPLCVLFGDEPTEGLGETAKDLQGFVLGTRHHVEEEEPMAAAAAPPPSSKSIATAQKNSHECL